MSITEDKKVIMDHNSQMLKASENKNAFSNHSKAAWDDVQWTALGRMF